MPTWMAALAALTLLAPLAPAGEATPQGGFTHVAQCHALAPVQDHCTTSFTTAGNSSVSLAFNVAYSGLLTIVAEQRGSAIWNVTCVAAVGIHSGAIVGTCLAEDADPPAYVPNVMTNVTVAMYVAGAGTYGVRVDY